MNHLLFHFDDLAALSFDSRSFDAGRFFLLGLLGLQLLLVLEDGVEEGPLLVDLLRVADETLPLLAAADVGHSFAAQISLQNVAICLLK